MIFKNMQYEYEYEYEYEAIAARLKRAGPKANRGSSQIRSDQIRSDALGEQIRVQVCARARCCETGLASHRLRRTSSRPAIGAVVFLAGTLWHVAAST